MTAATDVLAMLRRHYLPEGRPAGGLFAPEIGAPNGRRRADLIWVPTSRSGAFSDFLVGHEVKVTRSDVIAELADPTKADPWMMFCSRWWLVVADPALVEGLSIPEAWGVMAPPSGRRTRSMTVLREAPRLVPSGDLSPVVTRIAAYVVNRVEDTLRQQKWTVDRLERENERMTTQIREAQQAKEWGGQMSEQAKRLSRILAEVEKRAKAQSWRLEYAGRDDDEAIITALLDHRATSAAAAAVREAINRTMLHVQHVVEPFRDAVQSLADATAMTTPTPIEKAEAV